MFSAATNAARPQAADLADPVAAVAATVETMPQLARVLRELRRREARRRGGTALTYRDLAAQTGWSRAVIGEYLTGTALPPTDRFDQLVQLLGATPAEWGPLATARDRIEEQRRPSRAPAWTVPVPRELPAPVRGFVGRTAQLGELDRLAGADDGGLTVVAICGGGGVGKTALAVHWGHRVADRFPDGHLYVDLRGYGAAAPVDAGDALGRFLQALGFGPDRIPASTDARATLYRTALAGRRVLVVLDNAAAADQVRPLLPGSSTCLVVVTSRDNLAGLVAADGAHRIGLDVLGDGAARTLLRGLLGNRVEQAPDAVEALIQLCGRLPLALRVAAVAVDAHTGTSLPQLVATLRDRQTLLDVLDVGDPRTAVRSVLSWSYDTLSPAAARLFRLLGGEPGPDLSLAALESLAGGPVRRPLAELTGAHLVTEVAPGRFAPHDMVRTYAAERLRAVDPPAERTAAIARLLDHHARTAELAAAALDPGHLGADAQTWFATERATLVAAVRLARDNGFADHAGRLAWALADHLDRAGRWRDWADCAAIALEVATTPLARARAHWGLARSSARLRRCDLAAEHYERAAEQFGRAGDGSAALGQEDEARAAWQTALSILDEFGRADTTGVRIRLAASYAPVAP